MAIGQAYSDGLLTIIFLISENIFMRGWCQINFDIIIHAKFSLDGLQWSCQLSIIIFLKDLRILTPSLISFTHNFCGIFTRDLKVLFKLHDFSWKILK